MSETGGYSPEEMYQRYKDGLTTPGEDVAYGKEHNAQLYDEADAENFQRTAQAAEREHKPDALLSELDQAAADEAVAEARRVYGGGLSDRQLQQETLRQTPDEPQP